MHGPYLLATWAFLIGTLLYADVARADTGLCCAELPLGTVRAGRSTADAPLVQTEDGSPWAMAYGWWLEVVERRASDGTPYDLATVLLNETGATPTVDGLGLLVDANGEHTGVAAFQSFPAQLREGTTNYRWRALDGTADTWLRRIRVHRSITTEHPASVRLELRKPDGSLLDRQLWLWSSTLALNSIDLTLAPAQDGVRGPLGEFTVAVWGSGYAAVSTVELCQTCVVLPSEAPATPSAQPTPSRVPSASPSAPPSLGSGCNTGSPGVCADGTWQRSTSGELVCTLNVLPSREVCDGLDNDCDGQVDEDFANRTTTCGMGACAVTVPLCGAGGPTQCTPLTPLRLDDPCDGVDNNCNGEVDEDTHTITCGVGACRRTVESCSPDGVPQECVPGEPSDELCDGLDNDCDGQVDEENVCQQPDYAVARRGPLLSPVCMDTYTATLRVVNTHQTEAVTAMRPTVHYEDGTTGTLAPLTVAAGATVTAHVLVPHGHAMATVALDETHQTALFDRRSPSGLTPPPCSQVDVSATASVVDAPTADQLAQLVPTVDSCVTRLDGYCNFTLGYRHAGPRPLSVAPSPDANHIDVAGGVQLQQNQPTVFWPGRARSVVYVRVVCPSDAWDSGTWHAEWRLGAGSVASARPAAQCPS